ncbi:hypothetical protein [Anaeromicropila populeti]|uniref:Bacteriocin-associated integral membrane (Putative immunity) protein n=1 Tax=Anaeromicropila populeti TaxID=37658 RepID=A0A1I6KS07_9FIRM|nr:hypothetical protein [Anaeromicropila populeti]SFR93964.1 hypothetical protein SAMN05661086_02638 [Anaeromicropila populeti]
MKKIYILFLLGQLIIFSYIFSNSIYDIYGLSHIGDTKLERYVIEQSTPDILSKVYEKLIEKNAEIQIVKMPISKDDNFEVTIYQIYHTNIEHVKKFKSISKNHYEYYKMTQDEFMDGTGVFYANLSNRAVYTISQKLGITIKEDNNVSYVSYKSVITQNTFDFIILLVTTQVVIFIYVISTAKQNAVKTLLGFSAVRILKDRVLELITIEAITIAAITIFHACYYAAKGKVSLFYILFLMIFLACIGMINVILMMFTQNRVKRIDVVSTIKNRMFTPIINNVVQVAKLILMFAITLAISMSVQSYHKLSETNDRVEKYKELNNFYSSYGYNSDKYEKIENNKISYLEMANLVKEMYQKNADKAYLMNDSICRKFDEHYMRASGKTREQLMDSYQDNNITVNMNYLKNYMNIEEEEILFIDLKKPTILVPQKYKDIESELKEYYTVLLQNRMYSEFYGEEPVKMEPLQIIYIKNGYQYRLHSSLQNEQYYDIKICDSIIILDNAIFSGTYYMQAMSECQLAFQTHDRDEFSVMLSEYRLNKLFHAYTMLIPFMQDISNYKFLIEQAMIFISLFFITLLFIIYVSNYIEVQVNNKKYGILYQMGHSMGRVLSKNIFISIIMAASSIVLWLLKINVIAYIIFVVFDFIVLLYLYHRIIIKNLYKILNGGN